MTVTQFVKQWVDQAEHDLEAARSLRQSGYFDICIVQCQQCGEKYLKALWAHRQQATPPRTHDLGELARTLGAPPSVEAAATELAGEYLTARYPDVAQTTPYTRFTEVHADRHLQLAAEVQQWTLTQLPAPTP